MYNHILVPLDGSELAECVLPHVQHIAGTDGQAKVSLVRVVDPEILPTNDPTSAEFGLTKGDRKQLANRRTQEAREYLQEVASRLDWDWAKIESEVMVGEPAESLARFANEKGVDLIIVASHGRSGIQRLIMGSIADRIIRSACVPVLLVRAPGCIPRV